VRHQIVAAVVGISLRTATELLNLGRCPYELPLSPGSRGAYNAQTALVNEKCRKQTRPVRGEPARPEPKLCHLPPRCIRREHPVVDEQVDPRARHQGDQALEAPSA